MKTSLLKLCNALLATKVNVFIVQTENPEYVLYLSWQHLPQDGFKPAKYFSIDRVYRNETLDATHLAEFYQVEGVVADHNFSIKNLMGVIGVRKAVYVFIYPRAYVCVSVYEISKVMVLMMQTKDVN